MLNRLRSAYNLALFNYSFFHLHFGAACHF